MWRQFTTPQDKPLAIVLDTVKGKGVAEVEQTMGNHSMNVGAEVFDRWLDSLRQDLAALEKKGRAAQ